MTNSDEANRKASCLQRRPSCLLELRRQRHRSPRGRKNNKHASIIPDIIEERRKSSTTGETRIYKYKKKGKYLGKGGFAECYTMTSMKDGRIYAGKVVSKSSLVKSKAKAKLIAEIKIHKHLNHRHIVKFEHFFEDKVNVYILLEIYVPTVQ